ncbi:MAG: hypothetical protein KDI19_15495 [Pseudomonadales bacterium]|nr:hypothetical protein [Pseudomonadales bacterium]
MFTLIPIVLFVLFALAMTWICYRLGQTKTENPGRAAAIGLVLSFVPPFALVYVLVLVLKEEVGIV